MVGGVFPLLMAIPRGVKLPNLVFGAANRAAIILEDEPLATAWGGGDYTEVAAHILHFHS